MSAGGRESEAERSSAAAELILPVERGHLYTLQFEDWLWAVDPDGAKVRSFSFRGQELLGGTPPCDGSTFWTSPQSDWGWPPVENLDSARYSARTAGLGTDCPYIEMHSPLVCFECRRGSVDFVLTKRFCADLKKRSILVDYSLEASRGSLQLAPWEVTRLGPGGLSVFAVGPGGIREQSNLSVTLSGGRAWFDHAAWTAGENQKAFADGAGGCVAHFTDGLMLLKTFSDVAPFEQAPGEAEIELYSDASGSYIELEQQGRFEQLAVETPLRYAVTWQLRPVPAAVPVRLGEGKLLDFIERYL